MKKILICGAKGMLGSHIQRSLTQRNIPFLAMNRQQLDITSLNDLSNFVKQQQVSHIINCAAYTQVDQAESELKQAYQVNAMGPHNLGIAARRHDVRIVHFSTDYVFDGKSQSPYTENHVCSPVGAYGMSKWAGEVKLFDEYPQACVIRASWLFGFPGKNFVNTMLKLMREKDHLRVVADQIGRPTYCKDLAEATIDLLDESGLFHFANASETSWHQFAQEIMQQAETMGMALKVKSIEPITTKDYPTPAKRPLYSTLSTHKIEQRLNRVPRPWKAALQDYLSNQKELQNSKKIDF